MKPIENKCMLITYANSMGKNLKELEQVLDKHFSRELGGVHILPFFPSSGDRGFAVINYDIVDPAFGTWEDIRRLSEKYFMAADFMLNHVSIRSNEFQDYLKNGEASPYRDMFIHWEEFWPEGEPTADDLAVLYSRKPQGPCKTYTLANGEQVRLWNTFFEEQVDVDPHAKATQEYYDRNLKRIAQYVPMIRFDAFAYASKVPGTSCFFVEPEIWDVLDISTAPLKETGTQMLAEIHENYHIQKALADQGHWVYDFALPLLLLHGFITGRTDRLMHWLKICPHNQVTTLDTHDGIGVVDAADLMSQDEMDLVCDVVNGYYRKGWDSLPEEVRERHRMFSSQIRQGEKKVKIYQLGGTFYSAMGEEDAAYLLARVIQFFTPGIPQVYYVGLLAGSSDFNALIDGEGPREVNRHNYSIEEIEQEIQRPMLQRMYETMRFRNTCPAFNGEFSVTEGLPNGQLQMIWTNGPCWARLDANLASRDWTITWFDPKTGREAVL